jgi:hypothetical protein
MAFQIRCNFNRINSYAEAVRAWEKSAIVFRNGRRGLVDRRKKHMTVELTPDENVVLRLYDHPVATWYKDGSITLCPYNSRSTVVFANHCTPHGMRTQMCGNCFSVTILERYPRTYRIKDQTTFRQRDGTWKPDEITPWSVPIVNHERAKQAFHETGYNEFRLWFKVYIQMAERPASGFKWLPNSQIVDMLRERQWRDLVTCRFSNTWHSPDKVLHEIRQAIYQECDCIEQKSVPFLG